MANAKLLLPRTYQNHICFTTNSDLLNFSSSLNKVHDQLHLAPSRHAMVTRLTVRIRATPSDTQSRTSELANDIRWDKDDLGFDTVPTDFMYVMKCCEGGDKFSDGELLLYEKIELNPFSSVLNYGQGIIEDLKAFKKEDDSTILLFRPEANGLRMRVGADRLCMPSPTIHQFVEAVKLTASANRRWVPPQNKGFLHIRPLLIGSGNVLSLIPSTEFIFLIYVNPVTNYFESGEEPINLVVENVIHRAVPGGVGSTKAIGNYAMVAKAQAAAKANGYHDVLYLDAVHNKYLEQITTANIFLVKDKTICTPALRGTILPGITRESIIDIARGQGFQVEERLVSVEELFSADEVFCTGNTIGLFPVASITYLGERLSYKGGGLGTISQQLCSALSNIQKGISEDKMGWTTVLKQEE
ncbi:branched-chain amino acid aminotransferase 2, chloroplastic isoform X1 [Ricinus communis]|uniref:branched-chain amino acid aminotransferase 2, chloroplastic isoform X1 n=1 Tax=Ricinus communis TaxID=3988 RepID=UPI0007723E7B|nr:branched-chain amino acid aminotransferase 2, chloroplastic isoform X1 [Ricinus communis]|eukprot:XP_015576066.1 branched-chain amino acid aminotransferase 2, chloroplastic isoform X1 [Ricinus communis]